MEGHAQGGGTDAAGTHVKTEALDESPSALDLGSRESHAPCRDTACGGGGGGGGGGGVGQTAEELQAAAATSTPLLLYPVSTERFFTASADGKTFLKIAPAAVMPPAPTEKALSSGSDFSSKAVLCLIEAVGRRWGLYETRERSQLFQSVQEEMASKGHVLPVEKIRRKWNNLIVTYKRVKDRSRETGHAKTSWEFFDLMDATLCDTIGSQIISSKRNRSGGVGGGTAPPLPGPLAKIAAKPGHLSQPAAVTRSDADFTASAGAEPVHLGVAGQVLSSAATSPAGATELKPVMLLNGDVVSANVQPAAIPSAPLFLSSTGFADAASASPSVGSVSSADLNAPGYAARKAPGVLPFRLGLSSFPQTSSSSCLTSSGGASAAAAGVPGAEGPAQRGTKEQKGVALFQEVVKRQEEHAYLDRMARRRVEAREKRRERREVRMSESLGRIATALELLSSKQDTVIALLQRLADRK